jgi:phosphoribosylamine--glycine ligase
LKFLIVGKGAREHALAWKLASSRVVDQLYLWPANPLSCEYGRTLKLPDNAALAELVQSIKAHGIDAVIVGPEKPLAEGLADMLEAEDIACFGPKKIAAQLESSKAFAKQMMQKAGIPTAAFELARDKAECTAKAHELFEKRSGVVLKADGLAEGKGVFVCKTPEEISLGIDRLYNQMPHASSIVVLEELLVGRECSHFSFIGKEGATELGFAVDFKRLGDGDHGPNTGGMGGYSPVTWLPKKASAMVQEQVIDPLLKTLAAEGIEYCGCLYVGIMWTATGLKVVEFNVRLGDPEAQILAVRDDRDWGALFARKLGFKHKNAEEEQPSYTPRQSAVGVVIASQSYPFYEGEEVNVELPFDAITDNSSNSLVFAAAITSKERRKICSGKGRVLTVVGRGSDLQLARDHAYARVQEITEHWPQAKWRTDIGLRVTVEEIPYGN